MAQTETAPPLTGSIADVAARLALWGRRAPKGLARVEFVSDFSRQEVVSQLRATLPLDKPLHEIELPFQQPALEVVHFLRERLHALPPGVVSITGFATAFADDCPLADSLRVLNFHRDNLAQFPLCQVWWMTLPFAETFRQSVPDLDSWFMLRLNLIEVIIEKLTEELQEIVPDYSQRDQARKQSIEYVDRFNKALNFNATLSELVHLAVIATASLHNAGLEEEEHSLAKSLLVKIEPKLYKQGVFSKDIAGVKDIISSGHVFASNNLTISEDFRTLAHLYEQAKDMDKAEALYAAALNVSENRGLMGTSDLDSAFDALSQFYIRRGRYGEAELLCNRWVEVATLFSNTSSQHNFLIMRVNFALDQLLEVYLLQERYSDAEQVYYKMLSVARRGTIPDYLLEKALLSNMEWLYKRLGRSAEAEGIARRRAKIASDK